MNKLKYILFFCVSLLVVNSCNDPSKVKSVFLSPDTMVLNVGESRQIEMFIQPISAIAYNSTAWSSTNTDVAVVDSKGNVTAIYAGECMIIGQASNVYDTCYVRVVTPQFSLSFDKISMYDIDDSETKRYVVLRLHDSSVSFDEDGNASGNGFFINLFLYAPISKDSLPQGDYMVNDNEDEYSIAPGEIKEKDGQYYITGSYLGQYHADGLSVIRIVKGSITISFNGVYVVECMLYGVDNEEIKARCTATPVYWRGETGSDAKSLFYNNYTAQEFSLPSEPTVNHIQVTLNCDNDTSAVFIARVPLSVNYIPSGKYSISNDISRAFTLLSTENNYSCKFIAGDSISPICEATLVVSRDDEKYFLFDASFSTAEESYVITKRSNSDKMRIKRHQYFFNFDK